MSRAEKNWERLVRAALYCEEHGAPPRAGVDLTSFIPPSLGQGSNIESIMNVANEIQEEDANVARILCEHAYSLAQKLDPNSEGRGVLQFKTGLISVIKQKLAKKEGERIDRSQDYKRVKEFYFAYKKRHNIIELEEQQKNWRKAGSPEDPKAMERGLLLKKGYSVLRVLKDVLEALGSGVDDPELKKLMETDAAKTEEFGAYNIIPLDAPGISDVILTRPEVKAAMAAMEYTRDLASMPENYGRQLRRPTDIFDVLEYIFNFQRDNTKNQRENLVLLLANAQSRMLDGLPDQDPQLDESAINKVVEKVLENYNRWCQYLRKESRCKQATSKKLKLMLVALYLLIWGEAGNVRFLPEGLCYIFHQMAGEVLEIVQSVAVSQAKYCTDENCTFLGEIIQPFYDAIQKETMKNDHGKKAHSVWRNYDDFNEFFWSTSCFDLEWPLKLGSPFFAGVREPDTGKRQSNVGKTNFVEHRTFLHLYHSFHRFWIFFALMFQGLIIVAFSNDLNWNTIRNLLSLGPTYLVMKFLESVLDVMLMYGAYKSSKNSAVSRIFVRFLWFGSLASLITYLYIEVLRQQDAVNSSFFHVFIWVFAVYIIFHLFLSLLMHIPVFRVLSNKCDNWAVLRIFKWIHQEHYYVGRGLYERTRDYLKYMLFWIVVLGCKFTFSYFMMIKPLVPATKFVVDYKDVEYKWHDFVSKNNYNALTVASIWSPVAMIYFLDVSVWYTVLSAIVGGLIGAKERLGEIRSLEMLQKRFQMFPDAFVNNLQHPRTKMRVRPGLSEPDIISKARGTASRFAPYWNEIITCLREEDYVSNRERDLLFMPSNKGNLPVVQWPLFLLASKIFLAIDLAKENKESQQMFWEKIKKDECMCLAVQEAYYTTFSVLKDLLTDEAKSWVTDLMVNVTRSIEEGTLLIKFMLKNLSLVVPRITALLGLLLRDVLVHDGADAQRMEAVKAMQELYDVVIHDLVSSDDGGKYDGGRQQLAQARRQNMLFSRLNWPTKDKKELIKRLHMLLTIKDSSANVPKNLEAQRRLQFFTNSLFMNMPKPPLIKTMLSFCVFTPYYKEIVLYSKDELQKDNEDGISTLFYLQKIFPDEWHYFLERIGLTEAVLGQKLSSSPNLLLELRLWASYRGQTLARTVRGMMYYKRALELQSRLEQADFGDAEENQEDADESNNDRYISVARAQADLKFTYVISCQIYGEQKLKKDSLATDILYLLKKHKALRVAYIDSVETMKGQMSKTEYYSKLVKADEADKEQEVYSIKLPGNPILGEGKPENQNHAIIFTRGEAIQTIDMNQDNYFEEALKMRNLLEEFEKRDHGLRKPTILGVREHVFTGSVSSLAWFMSNQETSFVTLGQRVLATPLKVRMHYGHPDVFDRIFHVTRGGISKSSKVINISEDIFAGFNSTLRLGNITHHEYIQVGKGRDVGLNQIALFEGKVAGGNGEQSLSRDVYRLGQLFDFFRMLSFFISSVGFYVCTMMTALTLYVFLYGKAYLALSGVGQSLQTVADITGNASLEAVLNAQFLIQIGIFTAVPMIMGFILEQGVLKAIVSFVTMQLQLASVFFTFSLGTRTHYFGRTILHGGAKYRATGRGFAVTHIKFADNYRLYSRSHFVKALEIVILLLVYLAYKSEGSTTVGYILLSFSSWFLALSWLFAPFIFNPSGFEWQKTVDDFDNWTNWLLYKGGVGVKGEESWEAWWEEEQEHIRHLRGKILETILSLRFFIFQYGVVYQLSAAGGSRSLAVYGISWLVLLGIVLIFKVFTLSQKAYVHLQMFLRLVQGTLFILIIGGVVVLVALTRVTIGDIFASALALVPTGWGILSIAIAWRSVVKRLGLWKSIRSIARFYDAAMGIVIFVPIAVLSWFPFVSTFQSRLLFNQAFSRGLEISLILAGNRPNAQV